MIHLRLSARPPTEAAPARARRAATMATAVLAAVIVWAITVPVLGVHLVAPSGPGTGGVQHIGLPMVVGMSAVASLAAWGLLAVLERRAGHARRLWARIAFVVLLISYGGPLIGAGVPPASRVALVAMHTVVAVVLFAGLLRTARR